LKGLSPNIVCSCGGTFEVVTDAEKVNACKCGTCRFFNAEGKMLECDNCGGTGKVVTAEVDVGVGVEKEYGNCEVCFGAGEERGCDMDDNAVITDGCYMPCK
jgi:hypothetical protein